MAINWEDAVKYSEIYSKLGLEDMIKTAEEKVTQYEMDKVEVAAGRKWNPLMKEGSLRELDRDIAREKQLIVTLKAALHVRDSREKHGHFDPVTMEIDVMMVEEA